MALPTGAGSWNYLKWLLRLAEYTIPPAVAWLESELTNHESVADLAWVRWVLRASRTAPAGFSEDVAQIKFDLLNITSGAVDTSWTAGDVSTVYTEMETFLTAIAAYTNNMHTWNQHRAYAMTFREPADLLRPFNDTGPPFYVASVAHPGTQASAQADQIAATATLRTAWPKHWGRVYLPGPSMTGGALTSGGRVDTAYRTAAANAVHALLTRLATHDFIVCVPVSQVNKQAFHGLLGVTDVVVDDVFDVQRRRRPRQVAARTFGTG